MNINPDLVITIIAVILIVTAITFIIKKAVKIALTIVAILIIFYVGYIATGTDLNEKFHLNKYLKGNTAEIVTGFVDELRTKQNKLGIVDEKKVYDSLVDGMVKAGNFAIDKLLNSNLEDVAYELAKRIYELGVENIDKKELEEAISKQVKNINPDDLKNLVNQVEEKLQEFKDSDTDLIAEKIAENIRNKKIKNISNEELEAVISKQIPNATQDEIRKLTEKIQEKLKE
jgi:hypothetical protein